MQRKKMVRSANLWQLSPMRPEDLEQVVAIEQQAFRHPWTYPLFIEELGCNIALNEVLFFQERRKRAIAAYICSRLAAGEMQILKIAVRPEYRHQRMGTWLLQHTVDNAQAKEVNAIFLETRISNKAALNLYHQQGFEIIDKRPKYYTDNREDALVMVKTL